MQQLKITNLPVEDLTIIQVDPERGVICFETAGLSESRLLQAGSELVRQLAGRKLQYDYAPGRYQWALNHKLWSGWLRYEELAEALWIELAHPHMWQSFWRSLSAISKC